MDDYLFDTELTEKKGLKYYVLIIYDIVDDKRRRALVKLMKSFGFRVQKSAFEAHLSESKYNKMMSKITPIAKEDDSIRVYKIRGKGAITVIGKDDTAENEDVIII